jgi:hypothetical protein
MRSLREGALCRGQHGKAEMVRRSWLLLSFRDEVFPSLPRPKNSSLPLPPRRRLFLAAALGPRVLHGAVFAERCAQDILGARHSYSATVQFSKLSDDFRTARSGDPLDALPLDQIAVFDLRVVPRKRDEDTSGSR